MQPRRDVGLAPLLPSHSKGASPVAVKLRRKGFYFILFFFSGVGCGGGGGFSLVFR